MSQFNEFNDNQLESKDEFAQHFRTFRPRSAKVSLDQIYAEQLLDKTTSPVLFPAQSVASGDPFTQSSWLRVCIAWSGGMVMGAAITVLLTSRVQTSVAQSNRLENDVNVSNIEQSTENKSNPNMTEATSADVQLANHSSNNLLDRWDLRYPIDLPEPNLFEDRPLTASYRRLRLGTQSGRPRSIPETKPSDLNETLPNSIFEIDFEPSKPKSQRHSLMREILEESI